MTMPNNTGPMDEQVERLFNSGQALSAAAFTTYRKRNGQIGTIEGDDGEMCFIVPHDELIELRAAIEAMHSASVIDEGLLEALRGGTLSVTSFDGHAVRIDFETRAEADAFAEALANQRSGSNG